MTREVHAFLSESGCINLGVALEGEAAGGQAPSLAEAALAHSAWTVLQTADMQVAPAAAAAGLLHVCCGLCWILCMSTSFNLRSWFLVARGWADCSACWIPANSEPSTSVGTHARLARRCAHALPTTRRCRARSRSVTRPLLRSVRRCRRTAARLWSRLRRAARPQHPRPCLLVRGGFCTLPREASRLP